MGRQNYCVFRSRHVRLLALDALPKYPVENLFVRLVVGAEVELRGLSRPDIVGLVLRSDVYSRSDQFVRSRIRTVCEALEKRSGGGIILRKRLQPQYQLHRSQEGGSLIHRAVDEPAFRVRTNHESDSAMRIDMIRSILRVVLDHENCGLFPEFAVRNGIDYFS